MDAGTAAFACALRGEGERSTKGKRFVTALSTSLSSPSALSSPAGEKAAVPARHPKPAIPRVVRRKKKATVCAEPPTHAAPCPDEEPAASAHQSPEASSETPPALVEAWPVVQQERLSSLSESERPRTAGIVFRGRRPRSGSLSGGLQILSAGNQRPFEAGRAAPRPATAIARMPAASIAASPPAPAPEPVAAPDGPAAQPTTPVGAAATLDIVSQKEVVTRILEESEALADSQRELEEYLASLRARVALPLPSEPAAPAELPEAQLAADDASEDDAEANEGAAFITAELEQLLKEKEAVQYRATGRGEQSARSADKAATSKEEAEQQQEAEESSWVQALRSRLKHVEAQLAQSLQRQEQTAARIDAVVAAAATPVRRDLPTAVAPVSVAEGSRAAPQTNPYIPGGLEGATLEEVDRKLRGLAPGPKVPAVTEQERQRVAELLANLKGSGRSGSSSPLQWFDFGHSSPRRANKPAISLREAVAAEDRAAEAEALAEEASHEADRARALKKASSDVATRLDQYFSFVKEQEAFWKDADVTGLDLSLAVRLDL